MPEGPSIVILKELLEPLHLPGQTIAEVQGNTSIDQGRLAGRQLLDIKSWGKHFLLCFDGFSLRIHFMLFGTYRINERKDTVPRISLVFPADEVNFYTCSLKFIEGDIEAQYDWAADVMSDRWDPEAAAQKLLQLPDMLVCDALLDQQIFSGVGNIIKNEVLYRIRLHPLTRLGDLPEEKRNELIREARNYSFDFLRWKKEFTLKKHWLANAKKTCQRCQLPFHKEYPGKTKRRTFYCTGCQLLYEAG